MSFLQDSRCRQWKEDDRHISAYKKSPDDAKAKCCSNSTPSLSLPTSEQLTAVYKLKWGIK